MSRRVFHDPDAAPNLGDNRSLLVMADITDEGLQVDGYDYTSWPSKDYLWHIHVAPGQIEKLRTVLGAESGDDTLDVLVSRIDDGTYAPWLNLNTWLTEHGIQFTFSSRWAEN